MTKWLLTIINNLQKLRKHYELVDINNKILKALPLKDYSLKVASREEADEDFGKVSTDELTYEMTLKKEEEQEKERETKRKPLAIKSSTKPRESESSNGSESSEDEDEDLAIVSKKQGHIKADCFKSKNKKKFEKKKEKKRAFKATWNDISSSEDEDEEVANLFFVAQKDAPSEIGGISNTSSMRGTVCYVAHEYGGGGLLLDKSDVYNFGVLLLVLITGRRPLQVTSSPMSEFQRANLIHWARHLARAGKLLDLVNQSVQSDEDEDDDERLLLRLIKTEMEKSSEQRLPLPMPIYRDEEEI
ncbi:receptor-like serine/threonine-protein kinase At2g45590 [Ricinus communis]|uniref:receptor-like serine/threonine-protein kinase At2g45590 n=1 Tax=Ricinus communis TaxID=3988 RepID=UPI00201AF015|nr:receptor-like serine/threonine-protein kinase At2g45590 [Ricinus communis]